VENSRAAAATAPAVSIRTSIYNSKYIHRQSWQWWQRLQSHNTL